MLVHEELFYAQYVFNKIKTNSAKLVPKVSRH